MSNVDTSAAYFYCVRMPARRTLALRLAAALGLLEAVALAAYGVSVAVYEGIGDTTGVNGDGANLAPPVLIGLFALFAGLVLLVTGMLYRGKRSARTPFVLIQAFGIVIAQPLFVEASTRWMGGLLAVVAIVAVAGLWISGRS